MHVGDIGRAVKLAGSGRHSRFSGQREQSAVRHPVQFAEVPKFPPAQIADFIRNEFTKHREAEGVYMLGSAWKTLDLIGELEETLNVPVVHPGPARCWEVQLRLGLHQPIAGYGRLLAEMPEAAYGD